MSMRSFWPKNDENTLYIDGSALLSDIMNLIHDNWGKDVDLRDITIAADYIHTDCLTYDLYDANDWTKFLVISRYKEPENKS